MTGRPAPDDIIDFWIGETATRPETLKAQNKIWFSGGPELDKKLKDRFLAVLETLSAGPLATDWAARGPRGRLAAILVLDQFSRNVHRGSARAFSGDGRAQRLVLQSLALDEQRDLPPAAQLFFYMPLMHAESLALQFECVERFAALARRSPPETAEQLQGNLRSARQHLDIIEQFGRFPHRNAALGRANTPAEEAFLKDGPRFGQ